MSENRARAAVLVVSVFLVPFYASGVPPEPMQPEGEVVMSTDKATYCLGENVSIAATGWAVVPNIGDFPVIFWAITDEAGDPVFQTWNLLTTTGSFNGTLSGTWNQTYRLPPDDPHDGEQVPPGTYTVWFYEIPVPVPAPGWIPTEMDIVACAGPVADAGPDQTVNEGDQVQFNGTGSYSSGAGSGEWTAKAQIPFPTWAGGSATLGNDVYYAGGNTIDPAIIPQTSFRRYDSTTDSWSNLTDLPAPRAHLGLAAAAGRIYAIGGNNDSGSTDTTFEFDPITNGWTSRSPMPVPMEAFGVATLNDRIYVLGGSSTWIDCYPCGSVFEYNPATDTWATKPDMPTGRAHLAAAVLDDKIFAIGGDSYGALSAVEVYDPVVETWTTKANVSTPRLGLSAEALAGRIYAFGGTNEWGLAMNSTERYDPSTDNWTVDSPMLVSRIYFGSGAVGDCMYAMGGIYGPFIVTLPDITEEYCLSVELEYEWDFDSSIDSDGDGNFTNDVDATGPTPTHIYYDDGVYVVTLTVTDTSGLGDWDTCNITVLNVAPTPEWTSQSSDGTILNPPYPEGKMILFTATVSDPGIYDTFTYDWGFGDGTVLMDAGPSVTHAYGDNDIYIVVLTVTDDDGGVGIDDTPPLETTSENPVASIDMPFCIFSEGTNPCAPIGTFTDPGWLDTHAAVWNFGDGTYETAALSEENDPPDATGWNITSHIYGDDGTYTITFTVTDDDGGVGSASAEAQVMNLPPTLEMDAPSPVNEGEDLILDITASDPGSDDIILTIDWGDGTIETMTYYNDGIGPDPPNSGEGVYPFVVTASLVHMYGDNGDFLIQVTAEDDDGGVVEDSTTAEVLNLPPEITLLAIPTSINENEEFTLVAEATDPGSDDIEISWTFELGPSMSTMFYNDGIGPDPPMSPWGTYPFTAQNSATHNYGDNGVYEVTITATDDDGGVAVHQVTVTVDNVAPTAGVVQYYLNASFAFRIAGEKWHNVEIHLYEDEVEVGYADITRYPGSPNEQMADLGEFSIDFSKTYSAVAYYTPEDDPINGQIWGATPAWVILEYEDGEERIHHTFNVRHEHTWTWVIDDFSPYFLGHNITFIATASDPGSDDLTFMWDWGDGNVTENTYYNDGIGPDPYPSPEVNPITVTDTARHAYASAGTYTITLTVMDDDGGVATFVLRLTL